MRAAEAKLGDNLPGAPNLFNSYENKLGSVGKQHLNSWRTPLQRSQVGKRNWHVKEGSETRQADREPTFGTPPKEATQPIGAEATIAAWFARILGVDPNSNNRTGIYDLGIPNSVLDVKSMTVNPSFSSGLSSFVSAPPIRRTETGPARYIRLRHPNLRSRAQVPDATSIQHVTVFLFPEYCCKEAPMKVIAEMAAKHNFTKEKAVAVRNQLLEDETS